MIGSILASDLVDKRVPDVRLGNDLAVGSDVALSLGPVSSNAFIKKNEY